MGHYFRQEEETLKVIREIDNPHLIMPIASYQFHGEENGCFLFPWADGGNLREFWVRETTRPLKDSKMITWVLKQICGLCHALSILHHKEHRHGDLKPENILLFSEGDYRGTLRIADVGLARFHKANTEQRRDLMQNTKTMTGTTRYVSPEFVHSDIIPRVFDVWALGCVYVEFLIWTCYGIDQLRSFNKMNFDYFWEKNGSEFIINPVVQPWLDRLSEDLKNLDTALADLLFVIKSHMLIPTESGRMGSVQLHEKLAAICDKAAEDSLYLLNPGILSKISVRNKPSNKPSGNTLAVPGPSKAPRPPLPTPHDSIEDGQGHNDIPPITIDKAEDIPSESVTTVPDSTAIAQEVSFLTHWCGYVHMI